MPGEALARRYTEFEELERTALAIAKSKLFSIRTPEEALVLMLISRAEGRDPVLAARDYDIIQNKPAKKTEAMHRDFLTSGGSMKWLKLSEKEAEATFSHPLGGEVTIRWDLAMAQQAELLGKANWKKTPRAMLRSRCVSEGVRSVCPMATSGMHVPEEVRDFEVKAAAFKNISPRDRPDNVTLTTFDKALADYGGIVVQDLPQQPAEEKVIQGVSEDDRFQMPQPFLSADIVETVSKLMDTVTKLKTYYPGATDNELFSSLSGKKDAKISQLESISTEKQLKRTKEILEKAQELLEKHVTQTSAPVVVIDAQL